MNYENIYVDQYIEEIKDLQVIMMGLISLIFKLTTSDFMVGRLGRWI